MNDQVIVTKLPDGSFHVKESGGAGVDQSVKSVSAVVSLIRSFFASKGGDAGAAPGDAAQPADFQDSEAPDEAEDPQAAWDEEAAQRQPDGFRN